MLNDLRAVIQRWKEESDYIYPIAVGNVRSRELTLCTKKPGILIGNKGERIHKYLNEIRKLPEFSNMESIHWVELDDIIV